MMKMTKILKYLFIVLIAVVATSCDDDDKKPEPISTPLDFIGDSLVAGWELEKYFPAEEVQNYGKYSARIEYIEECAGNFDGRTVVVQIGTNDNQRMMPEILDWYTNRYMKAIIGLGAKKIYLFSVLPRNLENDTPNVNTLILNFNDRIKEKVKEYPQITYIDVYYDFLIDGKPNPALYSDGLHLMPEAYEIMTAALNKAL